MKSRLFIGLSLIVHLTSGQFVSPVTIVKAPTLEALTIKEGSILTTMNVTLATMEQAEKKLEKLREVTDWLNKLESIQEFIHLLETTVCLAKDLNIDLLLALDILGARASCLNEFRYKVNINQLRYVVDVINVVLSEGFNMSRSGRLEAYNDALSTFQKAQIGLGELAVFLKRIIRRYERAKAYKEELYRVNDFTQYSSGVLPQ